MAKEVWLEGSFAGEIQIEGRETGLGVDDDVARYIEDEREALSSRYDDADRGGGRRSGGSGRGARRKRGAGERGADGYSWDDEFWDDDELDDDGDTDDWFDDLADGGGYCGDIAFGDFDDVDESDGTRKRSSHNKELGRRGEQAAARYLELKDYEVLERNYTCPFGEADIIARDGDTLVFVEVKTRSGVARGFPSEAVDEHKRARYERIAGWYLHDYDAVNIPVRFDVIAIMVVAADRGFIRHYVNAFGTRL